MTDPTPITEERLKQLHDYVDLCLKEPTRAYAPLPSLELAALLTEVQAARTFARAQYAYDHYEETHPDVPDVTAWFDEWGALKLPAVETRRAYVERYGKPEETK